MLSHKSSGLCIASLEYSWEILFSWFCGILLIYIFWNDWVLSDGSWTGFASPCLLLKCNWSKVATQVNSRVLKKTETNSRHFRKSNYTVSTCAKRIFSTSQLSDRKQWISKSVFYCTLLSSYSLVARLNLRSLWSLFKGEQMNAFTVRGVNYHWLLMITYSNDHLLVIIPLISKGWKCMYSHSEDLITFLLWTHATMLN